MEGFYGKQGGAREPLVKEKNYFESGTPFLFGNGKGRVFIMQIDSSLEWGGGDGEGLGDRLPY